VDEVGDVTCAESPMLQCLSDILTPECPWTGGHDCCLNTYSEMLHIAT
jgi:hypothetical protein